MPHWKSVAAQAKQPIDKAGVVQPVVAGQVLADNVIIDDPAQIALCDSTLPPAIVSVEEQKPAATKRPSASAQQGTGFVKRAFYALLLRPKPEELVAAAGNGQTDIVRLLLTKGADVNAKNSVDRAALMIAARYGRTDTVRLLLNNDSGADVNARDKYGDTALKIGEYWGHTKTAAVLRAAMAERNQKQRVVPTPGAPGV